MTDFVITNVIRSATTINAALLGRAGELGAIAPGAYADVLLVDGDPPQDMNVIAGKASTSISSPAPGRSSSTG